MSRIWLKEHFFGVNRSEPGYYLNLVQKYDNVCDGLKETILNILPDLYWDDVTSHIKSKEIKSDELLSLF